MFKILASFFLLFSSTPLESSALSPTAEEIVMTESEMTEEEKEFLRIFLSLEWKETGTYNLPQSNSKISIPEGYRLLIGDDAKQAKVLFSGDTDTQNLEAAIYDDDFKDVILLEYLENGYVSLDDWEEVDSKSLLDFISENTEKQNLERRKLGLRQLHVIGWLLEPTLDKQTNTVYWSIEALEDESNMVNSVAIRLGREGIEKFVWVTPKASYVPFGGRLDVMLRAHSFEPGFRYNDYITGDKVAGYGIATLVAATIGAKIAKSGGIAFGIKILGGFALAAIAGTVYKLKSLFRRKKRDSTKGD